MVKREFSDYFKSILFATFLIVLPLIYGRCNNIFRNEMIYCGTLLLLFVFVIIGLTHNPHANRTLDYLILLFFLCSILNIIFIKNGEFDRFVIYKWAAVVVCYFTVKQLNHKTTLLYGLVVSGVTQSFIVFFQKSGIWASNNRMFDISGSFGNPGQLGGYLAICVVISICLLINNIKNKNRLLIGILTVSLMIQNSGLYFADSRAGFLAVAVGTTVFFIPTIKKYKKLILGIIILLIFVVGVTLYFHRPASADGRLLIWRVSAKMIADKPFFGHGIGTFPEKYMLYQAEYFSENPTSVFISVADNTVYPFNELLNVMIQQGIVGLLFLLAIFYFAFQTNGNRIFQAALAAIVAFSMFSYPSAVFPLLLLFAIALGQIFDNSTLTVLPRNLLKNKIFFISLCLFTGFFITKDLILINRLSKSYASNNMVLFEQSYEKMQYNRTYHDYYLNWLIEYPNSKYSARTERILPSCENYCLLAEYFLAKKNYERAETALLTAVNMIPTRIRPKYLLFQLYVETGNIPATIETAQNILATPVKIESVFTLQVKSQIKKLLEGKNS